MIGFSRYIVSTREDNFQIHMSIRKAQEEYKIKSDVNKDTCDDNQPDEEGIKNEV